MASGKTTGEGDGGVRSGGVSMSQGGGGPLRVSSPPPHHVGGSTSSSGTSSDGASSSSSLSAPGGRSSDGAFSGSSLSAPGGRSSDGAFSGSSLSAPGGRSSGPSWSAGEGGAWSEGMDDDESDDESEGSSSELEVLHYASPAVGPKATVLKSLPVVFVLALTGTLYAIYVCCHGLELLVGGGSWYARGVGELATLSALVGAFLVSYALAALTPPGSIPDADPWRMETTGVTTVEVHHVGVFGLNKKGVKGGYTVGDQGDTRGVKGVSTSLGDGSREEAQTDVDATKLVAQSGVVDATTRVAQTDVVDATKQVAQTDVVDATKQVAQTDVVDATKQVAQTGVVDATKQVAQTGVVDAYQLAQKKVDASRFAQTDVVDASKFAKNDVDAYQSAQKKVDAYQSAQKKVDASKRHASQEMVRMRERKEGGGRRYCKWCEKYKPDRSHHCRVCRTCVLKMDHHCPWIYNCVGWANHKFFMLSLFYGALALLFLTASMGDSVARAVDDPVVPFARLFLLLFGEILAALLAVLLLSFLAFHLWLMARGLTTIEFCEKAKPSSSSTPSPWNRGCWLNCLDVFGTHPLLWLFPLNNKPGDGLSFPASKHHMRHPDAFHDDDLSLRHPHAFHDDDLSLPQHPDAYHDDDHHHLLGLHHDHPLDDPHRPLMQDDTARAQRAAAARLSLLQSADPHL